MIVDVLCSYTADLDILSALISMWKSDLSLGSALASARIENLNFNCELKIACAMKFVLRPHIQLLCFRSTLECTMVASYCFSVHCPFETLYLLNRLVSMKKI